MHRQIFQRVSQGSSAFGSPSQILLRNSRGRPSIEQSFQTIPTNVPSSQSLSKLSQLPSRTPSVTRLQPAFRQQKTSSQWRIPGAIRPVSCSRNMQEAQHGAKEQSYREEMKGKTIDPDEHDEEEPGFARSEKAAQASQLNLSARLSKDGTHGGTFISFTSFLW